MRFVAITSFGKIIVFPKLIKNCDFLENDFGLYKIGSLALRFFVIFLLLSCRCTIRQKSQ